MPQGPRRTRRIAPEHRVFHSVLSALVLLLTSAAPASAYIGPGAGFAVLSSFLAVFVTVAVAVLSVLLWPVRALVRSIRGGTAPQSAIRRLVIVGFDGQDPELTDRFMNEGLLPNFSRLAR